MGPCGTHDEIYHPLLREEKLSFGSQEFPLTQPLSQLWTSNGHITFITIIILVITKKPIFKHCWDLWACETIFVESVIPFPIICSRLTDWVCWSRQPQWLPHTFLGGQNLINLWNTMKMMTMLTMLTMITMITMITTMMMTMVHTSYLSQPSQPLVV